MCEARRPTIAIFRLGRSFNVLKNLERPLSHKPLKGANRSHLRRELGKCRDGAGSKEKKGGYCSNEIDLVLNLIGAKSKNNLGIVGKIGKCDHERCRERVSKRSPGIPVVQPDQFYYIVF